MAYGLKYRNNFEGVNDLTNVKYNVLLEILQDGYVGAVTEIEELDKNPLQKLHKSLNQLYRIQW